MLELAVKSLLAYLLGSLVGALLLGRLIGFDIRRAGSGNAGATNALRTKGPVFAALVLLIDLGKGWLAVVGLARLGWPPADPALAREWLAVALAVAVVLGHVYPVWYGFRGGKGAATLLGVVLGLSPLLAAPVLAVWLGVLALTRFVGLSTMLAAASFLVALAGARALGLGVPPPSAVVPLAAFGALATLFTVYTHRANIERMRAGTENRLGRGAR